MILNNHIDSKLNVRLLSKNNLSYLQIKLPRGRFIIFFTLYGSLQEIHSWMRMDFFLVLKFIII